MVVAEEYMRFQLCVNAACRAVQRSAQSDPIASARCGMLVLGSRLINKTAPCV
jgi:hypothetical protein